jgi:hypothetical protein
MWFCPTCHTDVICVSLKWTIRSILNTIITECHWLLMLWQIPFITRIVTSLKCRQCNNAPSEIRWYLKFSKFLYLPFFYYRGHHATSGRPERKLGRLAEFPIRPACYWIWSCDNKEPACDVLSEGALRCQCQRALKGHPLAPGVDISPDHE